MFSKPHLSIGLFGPYGHDVSAVGAALSAVNDGAPPTERRALDVGSSNPPLRHRWAWKRGARTEFLQWNLGTGEPEDVRWFPLETPKRRVTAARLPSYPWTSRSRMSHFAVLDALLLVVKVSALDTFAEEGLRTALLGAQHLCGRKLVVYLMSESDEDAELGRMVLTDLVRSANYAASDVTFVSGALEHETMRRLMRVIDATEPPPVSSGPLRMITMDAHRIFGRGTVLLGRVMRGEVHTGDVVELVERRSISSPDKVVSMEWFRQPMDMARSGDHMAVLLPNVIEDVRRGTLVVTPGSASPVHRFVATLRWGTLPPPAAPFRGRIQAQMFIEGAAVGALLLKSGARPRRGEHFFAEVELSGPLAVEAGMRFVLHDQHQHLAIGAVHEL